MCDDSDELHVCAQQENTAAFPLTSTDPTSLRVKRRPERRDEARFEDNMADEHAESRQPRGWSLDDVITSARANASTRCNVEPRVPYFQTGSRVNTPVGGGEGQP